MRRNFTDASPGLASREHRANHGCGKRDAGLSTLRVRFEEFDNVPHSKHAVRCFLRNLATKFLFKPHGELDRVEAIGVEIVNEISVLSYLIPIDAEMFGDDPLNPLANITHRFPTSLTPAVTCAQL